MPTVLVFFSICLAVFQLPCSKASGAPQHPNLPWVHPSSMMNMQIRPLPALGMAPASYFDPMPYQLPNQLPPMPFQVPGQPLIQNIQAFPDDVSQVEPLYDTVPYLDPDLQEFRQNGNGRECDPRQWSNRKSCSDSNTVRTCTASGTYRYTQCPQSWRCAQGLGICLRPFRQQFTTRRSFTCPEFAGTYPDPHSCKVYHVCTEGTGSTPETNYCYWPQVYDPVTQSCQMDTPDTPCYRIKCFSGQSAVAYPGDPRVYANCTRPGIVGSISRCTDGNNAYNETSKQCDVTSYCIQEGNIPGPSANQYYTCSRVFRRLIRSELKTCVGDLQFNPTFGMCSGPTTADDVRSDHPQSVDGDAALDHWTTEELVRALQESAFILKEEDDPEAAPHVRGKRIKRSHGIGSHPFLEYFNPETSSSNEKSPPDSSRVPDYSANFLM